MRIVGTAGHVDHGKSALVISLTGHDPDRLAEERERGMTIDLGFAPLRFDDGLEAGIIDVPGHERFLHNMLAGAAGIDVLLLVIDALEGPRRQTIEHLAILDLLHVHRAIVVLTKADLADADRLAVAASEARGACVGTVADGAPVIAVSNLTGKGIAELRAVVRAALATLPARDLAAPACLPVDRVIALPGRGTIVTGTLMQGVIAVGDALTVQPSGRPVRVRSLQIFGRDVDRAEAGARVAAALPGVAVGEVQRGDALAASGIVASDRFAADFTPAIGVSIATKRVDVRTHAGSAEVLGRLRFETAPAGSRSRATVELRRPTVVYPGMRIVFRRVSPKDLLGGGVVLGHGSVTGVESAIASALDATGLSPMPLPQLVTATNTAGESLLPALEALVRSGSVLEVQRPHAYLSMRAASVACERVRAHLESEHAQHPWRTGLPVSGIASLLGVADADAVRLLEAWREAGRFAARTGLWHLPGFVPRLSDAQRKFFREALGDDPAAMPASLAELQQRIAASPQIDGLGDAFASLASAGAVVRVGDDLYRRSQIARLRERIGRCLASHPGGATMSQLREASGLSRRYALPLMEYFDTAGFTVRDGDVRRLRAGTLREPVQVSSNPID